MATQTATGSGPTRNNGGTIVAAGNVNTTSGPVKVDLSLQEQAVQDDEYGSKVVLSSGTSGSSGNLGTYTPVSAGTFAYQQVAGTYLMRRQSTTIGGVANTTLNSGASDYGTRKNPLLLETTRTYGSGVTQSWNYVTGAITKGGNAGGLASFSNDHAARPTAAIPGELVYMYGAIVPQQADYKPRTG